MILNQEPEVNQELRELVEKIKQLPPKSRERRKLINELIDKIQKSRQLNKFSKWRKLPYFDDLYADALANTFMYIKENIEKYNPEYEVMAWVNQTLQFKFLNAKRQYQKKEQLVSLDALNYDFPAPSENEDCRLLREFIEQDPENLLKEIKYKREQQSKSGITNGEEVSLQDILLMRLDGNTLKEIGEKFQIPLQSVHSFIERNLRKAKIRDYFNKYLGSS